MMLELALQKAGEILTNLPWTEKYGGLVRVLKVATETERGVEYKSYPVRKGLTAAECASPNAITQLAPNSAYRNLIYFEPLSNLQEDIRANTLRGQFAMTAKVRLVYWLNLAKMGFNIDGSEEVSGRVAAQLIAALSGDYHVTSPHAAYVIYEAFSVVESSPLIFQKYSYDERVSALMLYPYDYGALEFTVKYAFSENCLTDIALGTEIECVTEW